LFAFFISNQRLYSEAINLTDQNLLKNNSEMGLVDLFVDLIFQPGSSLKLVPVINVSVLLLLVVIAYLLIYNTEIATIHIIVLSSLAVGLLISVNW